MTDEDNLLAMRREIERIKDRIDDISHIQAQQVRADGKVKAELLKVFTGRSAPTRIKLFLAVDGRKSLTQIASAAGVAKSTASEHLIEMFEHGLVGFDDLKGEKVYRKSTVDRALGLTKELQRIADNSSPAT